MLIIRLEKVSPVLPGQLDRPSLASVQMSMPFWANIRCVWEIVLAPDLLSMPPAPRWYMTVAMMSHKSSGFRLGYITLIRVDKLLGVGRNGLSWSPLPWKLMRQLTIVACRKRTAHARRFCRETRACFSRHERCRGKTKLDFLDPRDYSTEWRKNCVIWNCEK